MKFNHTILRKKWPLLFFGSAIVPLLGALLTLPVTLAGKIADSEDQQQEYFG